MTPDYSVFVSYSGRSRPDKNFAVRLLVRLNDLGIPVWIYEQRGSEVPVGAEINNYCRKQIRKAELFVALISDSSLESPSTRLEVEYALTVFGPSGIFQISTTTKDSSTWPAPYVTLAPYKRVDASAGRELDLERCIEDICTKLKADYSLPVDGAPRLPLVHRLTQEMHHALPSGKNYEVNEYRHLQHLAMEAATAYGKGQLEDACSLVDCLDTELSRIYADESFYYTRLIKGVIRLELADKRPECLDQANQLFQGIIEDKSLVEKVDENLYAALAVGAMKNGDTDKVISYYLHAQSIVQKRGQVDPDIIHNLVVAHLALGTDAIIDIDALIAEAMNCGVTSDPMLMDRLCALQAAVRAKSGDFDGAKKQLKGLDQTSQVISDVLLRIAQELGKAFAAQLHKDPSEQCYIQELFQLAISRATEHSRATIQLSLAGFLYSVGQYKSALEILDLVDQTDLNMPQLCVEKFWCLFQMHMHDKAENLLHHAAEAPLPSNALTARKDIQDFFYYRGLAAWLLGDAVRSQRDFRDSGHPSHLAYPLLMKRHGK